MAQVEPSNRHPCIPSTLPTATDFRNTPLFTHPTENCFTDSYGRTILLRGLNVGGDSKVPTVTKGRRRLDSGDEEEEVVRYSGRPFRNEKEAEEWWGRLRMWGVGVVRWVITWEAVEPKVMGEYDDEYIDYMYKVLEKAGEKGLKVFVDIHQDCWSRLSGGSGAPPWTFSLVGLDPSTFHATYTAALLPPSPTSTSTSPKHLPTAPYIFSEPHLPTHSTPLSQPSSHLWATNYTKFSVATMFTIFFAGSTFAPGATISIDGEKRNVGAVLQEAYLNAFRYVAKRLAGLECIMGWDVMNEPHPGYIGLKSLKSWNQNTELHLGVMPSAVQGMVLASGGEIESPASNSTPSMIKLPVYHRSWPHPTTISRYVEYPLANVSRVWSKGKPDIWRDEGVWWWDSSSKTGYSCKDDYFTKHPRTSTSVDFERDFYEPFLRRFLASIAAGREEGLKGLGLPLDRGMGRWAFIEPVPNIGPPNWVEERTTKVSPPSTPGATIGAGGGVCYAPHWYDLRACFEKRLSYTLSLDVGALALGSRNFYLHSYFGRFGLMGNYTSQLKRVISRVAEFRRGSGLPTPVLVGETGIPFDMNAFEAYKTGDIHWQIVMLDSIAAAMERVGKGATCWTLWNFTGENYVVERDTLSPSGSSKDTTTVGKEIESGDGWNSEDFSLVSLDHSMTEVPFLPSPTTATSSLLTTTPMRSLHSSPCPSPNNLGTPLIRGHVFNDLYMGVRCTGAWIRPYPTKTAGVLMANQFTLGNVDCGSRECWGGRWEMRYCASSLRVGVGGEDMKMARKTEVFLPAYHFGGAVWRLEVSITRKKEGESMVEVTSTTTIRIDQSDVAGVVVFAQPTSPSPNSTHPQNNTTFSSNPNHGTLSITWTYSEAHQTLTLIHSPGLGGCVIEVSAEVNIPETNTQRRGKRCAWGYGRGGRGQRIVGWVFRILVRVVGVLGFAVVAAVVAVVLGSWYVERKMVVKRVEFGERI